MIEVRGNLWEYKADVRVITTNGTIKKDGSCVMGRGCAAEAKKRWPFIAGTLGRHITSNGNVVGNLGPFPLEWRTNPDASMEVVKACTICSFPVKHNWWEKADPALIERSARQLIEMLPSDIGYICVMPRPGCGNGSLNWDDVRPVLAPILDDRFRVITF